MEDMLGLEVGYRLIPMVDHEQQGQLLTRAWDPQEICPADGLLASCRAYSR
jgi:flagellar biosynthesis component FlhA